jgi:CheY-like chemotaxis protein
MVSVVVCDDDRILRGTVSDLCTEAGLEVVAETDSGTDAIELVRRFGVDALVLDLSLPDGSGEQALAALRELDPQPAVVVFTAYASDPARLIRLGAREVVEKPDFDRLASVLAAVAEQGIAAGAATDPSERRRTSRPVEPLADLWRSPSGISTAADLPRTIQCTTDGDALLLVSVHGLGTLEADVGRLLAADCLLTCGRLLRATLRVQDVVHESTDVAGFVAVLRGGDARAAEAAWDRLEVLVGEAGLPVQLSATHARVDNRGAPDALTRVLAVGRSAGPGVRSLIDA